MTNPTVTIDLASVLYSGVFTAAMGVLFLMIVWNIDE